MRTSTVDAQMVRQWLAGAAWPDYDSPGGYSTDVLVSFYEMWCADTGRVPCSRPRFIAQLRAQGFQQCAVSIGVGRRRQRWFRPTGGKA